MQNPAPPGKKPGEAVAATGAIYGMKDVGRKWYFHLRKTLGDYDIRESAIEKGLCRLFHKTIW